MTVWLSLALGLPAWLFARWMWTRWHDLSDRVPVSDECLASINYRLGCTGYESVCHTGPFKR